MAGGRGKDQAQRKRRPKLTAEQSEKRRETFAEKAENKREKQRKANADEKSGAAASG